MIDIEQFLYDRVLQIFDGWHEEGIYAVSFFVYSNELHIYRGFSNVTNFSVSYNTEEDCEGAGRHSEERWNYAFWRQDAVPIFDSYEGTPETEVLFDWYAQQGTVNVGYEDGEMDAPVGFAELVEVLGKVARRFHDEGYFVRKFGRAVPILIHDLEYIPCTLAATAYANPDGEAADFLAGNWEDGEPDYDVQEVDSKVSAMIGNVAAHLGDQDYMNRLLEIQPEDSEPENDPDVDAIMKLVFGDGYRK